MNDLHKPTERVLTILLILSDHDGLTLTELSNISNIPKGTISPILKTLTDMKFIHLSNNNLYKIGANSFKVGSTFMESFNVIDMIKSSMKEIVEICNEICQLGIYDNGNVLYIEKIEPKQSIKLVSSVGKTIPAYSSAIGKALLTQFTNEEVKTIYTNGLLPITKHTITDIDVLIDNLNESREKGFAYESMESNENIECFAVPLEANGSIFSAISISIPIFRNTREKSLESIEILLEYKEKIEKRLKYINIDI